MTKTSDMTTAENTVNYSFRFGTGDSEESSSGTVQYTYTDFGLNTYNVNLLAFSSTNHFITISQTIQVYVTPQQDADMIKVLAGNSQKIWKINAAYDAHLSNGDRELKYPTWWEASSFSKSNTGFYDDKFIFEVGGTYVHETNGDVYGKANYLNQTFGNTGQPINSSGEIEKYTLSNYQTNFTVIKENDENVMKLITAIKSLKNGILFCEECCNLSDKPICGICTNDKRDSSTTVYSTLSLRELLTNANSIL